MIPPTPAVELVGEKAKHLFLPGKLEANAEGASLLRSFCPWRMYKVLAQKGPDRMKIRVQPGQELTVWQQKTCVCERAFLPLSGWVTLGK